MGTRSTDSTLTENRGGSGPAGSQLYVGIDVGRHSHLVAAIPGQRMADGSWEHMAPRRFATSAGGYRELVEWLALSGLGQDQIKIGIEPTGGWYARTVVGWLERNGYEVDWCQNWAVHERRQLAIGKQAKTDALDARLIARLLYERECLGLMRGFLHRPPRPTEGLRMLLRNRLSLVGLQGRYRNQLTMVEDVLFPELKEFFPGSTTGPVARLMLENFPTPDHLFNAEPDRVYDVIVRHGHYRRIAARIDELRPAAYDSAGLVDSIEQILRVQRWLLHQLRMLDDELKVIESAIAEALQVWPVEELRILESLPGCSPWRQAVLLAAIGDIQAFSNERQLRKLLGWYPEAKESGTSIYKHRLGQSGNRIARRELWLWAVQLISPQQAPNPFEAYYQRLRMRGMTGKVAVGHLASKLVSVLFFCLRGGQPYDPERHARDLGLTRTLEGNQE
jgi:transposase